MKLTTRLTLAIDNGDFSGFDLFAAKTCLNALTGENYPQKQIDDAIECASTMLKNLECKV